MITITVKEFLWQEKKSALPYCLETDFTLTFPAFVTAHLGLFFLFLSFLSLLLSLLPFFIFLFWGEHSGRYILMG